MNNGCDCAWAAGRTNCGDSDGSACWAVCCGSTTPDAMPSAASQGNVFAAHQYYVNPQYQQRVRDSIAKTWADDATRASLQSMVDSGSAFWIDTIARIRDTTNDVSLESVFRDASRLSPPPLVVVILYNLPNRDCHALASNGELCCQYAPDGTCVMDAAADPSCAEGLQRYQHHYVDPFVQVLEQYSTVPAAVVIEPDSLPNLATNMEDPKCGSAATQAACTVARPRTLLLRAVAALVAPAVKGQHVESRVRAGRCAGHSLRHRHAPPPRASRRPVPGRWARRVKLWVLK